MAPTIPLLLLSTIFAFLPGLYDCSHVARNIFREQGTFETPLGPRRYSAVSQLKMPLVQWADLAADGIKIAECSEASMTFEGKIDSEDFAKEIVIAFPKKLCAILGCPLPTPTEDILEREEVVFRQIISAAHRNRFTTVRTRFVSGKKVVPKTTLEIGSLVASEQKQVSSSRQLENASDDFIGTASRVGILGLNNEKRSTSFNLTENIKIDVEATISGGICEIVFDVDRADVLMTLSADLVATLTLDASFSDRRSGVLFKEGLPDLGVSLNLATIGRVSIGILFALEYVAELDLNAELSASFSASYAANSTVSLRLGQGPGSANAERMNDAVGQRSANLNPKFQIDAANFSVNGFIGLRPEIEAEIEVPLLGEAGLRFGGTVGLRAKATYVEPPFAPIAGRTDSCGACHQVGGSLDLVGRRLSVTILVPFFNDKEFTLADEMFDISIAKRCFYALSCPGTIEDEQELCPFGSNSTNASAPSLPAPSQALAETASSESSAVSQVEDSRTNSEGISQISAALQGGTQAGGVSSEGGSQEGGVSSEVISPPADSPTVNEEEEEDEDKKSDSESSGKSGSEKSDSDSSSDSDSESESESE